MVGVATSGAATGPILTAGIAGLAAGAMAMAAGEYVSVSSQADIELSDCSLESRELATPPQAEVAELTGVYQDRGLPHELAAQVAAARLARDPLAAHLSADLGHTETSRARPA